MPAPPSTVRARPAVADPETVSVLLGRSGPPTPRPIPRTLGPYRILQPIGSGGTGRVFLAEHQAMRRRAAIKVLADDAAADPGLLERFYREARALAVLDHPNIVRAYDVREADGFHFLVLEYAPGRDLAVLLRDRGPLPVGEAVGYAWQAAAGLAHAHAQGFIHRDVKPANLLVDESGGVKVLDLGLARSDRPGDARLTDELDSGTVLCTPDYVAPEQARGGPLDGRTDIYSLGVTLYAMLTGRPPFDGSVTQKLVAHQARAPRPAHVVRPDLPRGVSDLVARMMAKDPADRFATMADVGRALEPWKAGAPSAETAKFAVTVRPGTDWATITAEPPVRRRHRGRVLWPTALVVAALGAIALGLGWMARHST